MWFRFLFVVIICIEFIYGQRNSTNSPKKDNAVAQIMPKQASLYDDYELNDVKSSGNRVEGSGGAASLDEYADDEEDEQLSRITASTLRTSISTTVSTTTTPTTTTTTPTTRITTTTSFSPRMTRRTTTTTTTTTTSTTTSTTSTTSRPLVPLEPMKKRVNASSISSNFNDLDNEFKEDQEEYGDDLEDDAYYNEPTPASKAPVSPPMNNRPPMVPTRNIPVSPSNTQMTPILGLFNFLTRPPIATGILAGKYDKRNESGDNCVYLTSFLF